VRLDDLVEGPLHVEHHRVEAAALAVVDALDRPRHVVQLGEAHRLRQPPRGVDREDDDAAPPLGRPEPERGGRRRLADAPGAAAHDDAGRRVVEQGVDVQDGRALPGGLPGAGGAHAIPWSRRRSARS
jgi:hypothetical protein